MVQLHPRNLYVLLCRDFSQDSVDNMGSILKIIENFNLEISVTDLEKDGKELGTDILNIPISYVIATSWHLGEVLNKDEEAEITVKMFDAKNIDLEGPSQKVKVVKGSDRINMNFAVNGLPLKNHGNYHINASLTFKGKTIKATYPFKVLVSTIET